MNNYKPYSIEWNRRRYLSEAIEQYFNTNASTEIILEDIIDVLNKNIQEYKSRAERFQEVLDGLKSINH